MHSKADWPRVVVETGDNYKCAQDLKMAGWFVHPIRLALCMHDRKRKSHLLILASSF